MTIDTTGIMDALASRAAASGHFERVNGHEPKNAPGNGLTAAVWAQRLGPIAARSGLAASSALLVVNVRGYSNMIAEPQDAIDPNLVKAVDALMTSYSGDFDLGGLVAEIDLLGQYGTALSAEAGYLEQDRKMYRVMTITVPLVINDTWGQAV